MSAFPEQASQRRAPATAQSAVRPKTKWRIAPGPVIGRALRGPSGRSALRPYRGIGRTVAIGRNVPLCRSGSAAAASKPFRITFGPGRISGTFDLAAQEDADKMIEIINAMKRS
jgi:hypothetical protein